MRMVLAAGTIVERDLHVNEAMPVAHLGMNVPLRAAPGGPIYGAVMLSIDPKDYVESLQRWPLPSRSGEVLLVRREGDPLCVFRDRE